MRPISTFLQMPAMAVDPAAQNDHGQRRQHAGPERHPGGHAPRQDDAPGGEDGGRAPSPARRPRPRPGARPGHVLVIMARVTAVHMNQRRRKGTSDSHMAWRKAVLAWRSSAGVLSSSQYSSWTMAAMVCLP